MRGEAQAADHAADYASRAADAFPFDSIMSIICITPRLQERQCVGRLELLIARLTTLPEPQMRLQLLDYPSGVCWK